MPFALSRHQGQEHRPPAGSYDSDGSGDGEALQAHRRPDAARLRDHHALDTVRDYLGPVRKLLSWLKRVRLDRLANRLL
jgi:hypothetical protein